MSSEAVRAKVLARVGTSVDVNPNTPGGAAFQVAAANDFRMDQGVLKSMAFAAGSKLLGKPPYGNPDWEKFNAGMAAVGTGCLATGPFAPVCGTLVGGYGALMGAIMGYLARRAAAQASAGEAWTVMNGVFADCLCAIIQMHKTIPSSQGWGLSADQALEILRETLRRQGSWYTNFHPVSSDTCGSAPRRRFSFGPAFSAPILPTHQCGAGPNGCPPIMYWVKLNNDGVFNKGYGTIVNKGDINMNPCQGVDSKTCRVRARDMGKFIGQMMKATAAILASYMNIAAEEKVAADRAAAAAAAADRAKWGSGAQIVQGPFDKGVPAAYVAAATAATRWRVALGLGVAGVLGGVAYLALRPGGFAHRT